MALSDIGFARTSAKPRLRRPAVSIEAVGIAAAVGIWLLVMAFCEPWSRFLVAGQDARCYWVPGYDAQYALSEWTSPIAYVYSPAFLQALAPLKFLAWEPFLAVWTALLILCVRFLSGPRLFALALPLGAPELIGGNIHLLIAVVIVVGFRYPAAWSLVLLTKITPGVGLLWFAVRREWRALAIAFGATAVISAVSLAIDPRAWFEWIGVVASSAGKTSGTWAALPIPLWFRLPIALAVVVWGARTDRYWAVPVAAMLALPALWYGGLAILLAVIPLRDPRRLAHWSGPARVLPDSLIRALRRPAPFGTPARQGSPARPEVPARGA